MTRVVNIRAESYDVYIGRAGKGQDGYFGNPYSMVGSSEKERTRVLKLFEEYFLHRMYADAEFNRRVLALKGKTLGCFCSPKRCHGEIIADWIG